MSGEWLRKDRRLVEVTAERDGLQQEVERLRGIMSGCGRCKLIEQHTAESDVTEPNRGVPPSQRIGGKHPDSEASDD